MTDQSFRCREEIVEADAKTDLLDHFVGVLGVDVVLDSLSSIFAKVFWGNLNQICDLGL